MGAFSNAEAADSRMFRGGKGDPFRRVELIAIRFIALAGVFALPIVVGGCSQSADDPTKKAIDKWNDLADAIEKKDEEKAKSIVKDLDEIGKKIEEMKLRDDEKKITEKYKDDAEKANKRVAAAFVKNPEMLLKIDFKPKK